MADEKKTRRGFLAGAAAAAGGAFLIRTPKPDEPATELPPLPEWFNKDPWSGDTPSQFAEKVGNHLTWIYNALGVDPTVPMPEQRPLSRPVDDKFAEETAAHLARLEKAFLGASRGA